MKKLYVSPEMEIKKFSLAGNILLNNSLEDNLVGKDGGGLPDDDDTDTPNAIGYSGPGFGL